MPVPRSRDRVFLNLRCCVHHGSLNKITATCSEGIMRNHKGAALERVRDCRGACVEAQLRPAAA